MKKILVKTIERVKLRYSLSEREFLPKGTIGEVDEHLFENQDYFYVNFQNPFPVEGVEKTQVMRIN